MNQREPLGVIGVGYVGLVTAVCFAKLGHNVVCMDVDQAKLDRLRRGEVPIYEPGTAELMVECGERLRFTDSPAELFAHAKVAFVCVDTPPSASGDADLSRVEAVIAALPQNAEGAVLVMKSTVPVGTGKRLRDVLDASGRKGVTYASNPEFLREGSALHDFLHPDRVVVGSDSPEVARQIANVYAPVTEHLLITDVASAEMIKLASNAFLATKISFINEIANVCEEVGATVDVVAEGMGLDERIGKSFLRAGIGYGGSCFPKDVTALKQLAGNSGYHFQLLSAVIEVNELQKRRTISKLKRHLGSLRNRRIALWGLAFKPDTDDMREASSVVLAARLIAEGAHVVAFDPIVTAELGGRVLPRGVEVVSSALEAARGADAVVIVTEWPEFTPLAHDGELFGAIGHPLVIDGRNLLDPDTMRAAGFTYEGVGRNSV